MSLFELLPYMVGAWLIAVGGIAAWLFAAIWVAVRDENREDQRRQREDDEVAYLEQIPVPGRWVQVFPEAADMSASDGLGYFPGDAPGMG